MTLHDKLTNIEPINLFDYVKEIPIFSELAECKQNPKWHAEGDVLTHTNMALKEARRLCEFIPRRPDKLNVYLATLLHDFGKPYTTFVKNDKIVAYGHEQAGVSYAREFLKKYFPEFNYARREYILSLVAFHKHPVRFIADSVSDHKFKKLSLDANLEHLYYVSLADYRGRFGEGIEDAFNKLEEFKNKCISLGFWDGFGYSVPGGMSLPHAEYNAVLWDILIHNGSETNKDHRDYILGKIKKDKPFELMIMVGAPGSGKTTHIQSLYPHIDVISMDEERKRLCGDVNCMERNPEVFDNCYSKLLYNMNEGINTIWDATSPTQKFRKPLVDAARSAGGLVTIVVFDLLLDTLKKRNAEREKVVPEYVVEKFYRSLEYPKIYEYERLLVIDESFDPVVKNEKEKSSR